MKDKILEAFRDLGFKLEEEEGMGYCFNYEGLNLLYMYNENDEEFLNIALPGIIEVEEKQYISAILPQFSEVNEGEETLTLAVCNKVSREVKLAKVYIDQALKSVTASCEFFYTDMESLKNNVEHVLNILGMVRSAYHKAKAEFM